MSVIDDWSAGGCKVNNGDVLKALVKDRSRELDKLMRQCNGCVPSGLDFLSEAVKHTKDGKTVDILLSCCAAKSREGVEPYAITCVRSNPLVATIEALAKHGVSINIASFNGTPVTVEALQLQRHLPLIKSLVQHKASVTAGDVKGNTPLHVLLRGGYNNSDELVPIARLLLEAGASPSQPNNAGVTPRRLLEIEVTRSAIPLGQANQLKELLRV